MSKYPEITPREVGNYYSLRTWVEYGLKQSKNELGWADFRVTNYRQIERWWEIICSVYLMVSLHSEQLHGSLTQSESQLTLHPWWDDGIGWKNLLYNLRFIVQPFILFNLIKPWLLVFTIPKLSGGFFQLQDIINHLTPSIFFSRFNPDLLFSSA